MTEVFFLLHLGNPAWCLQTAVSCMLASTNVFVNRTFKFEFKENKYRVSIYSFRAIGSVVINNSVQSFDNPIENYTKFVMCGKQYRSFVAFSGLKTLSDIELIKKSFSATPAKKEDW